MHTHYTVRHNLGQTKMMPHTALYVCEWMRLLYCCGILWLLPLLLLINLVTRNLLLQPAGNAGARIAEHAFQYEHVDFTYVYVCK